VKDIAVTIKTLFDPSKDIYRTIEKVITYSASQEERLRTEIREYIVTDNIEEQFEQLLTKMQLAMDQGGQNEVGVWVSGFYGSGKSSFTKYLGLALRHNTKLEDARYYDADFDRQTFIDLYPFLPAHFDILLHLLGALAKSTSGIGLRSAIKLIQDILVEGADGHDIHGIRTLMVQEYVIGQQVSELKKYVRLLDKERTIQDPTGASHFCEALPWPAAVTSVHQLEELIKQLSSAASTGRVGEGF
jgi:hypothetical protein